MLILDRYRLGTIVSQRRMIFLATDSSTGRPVWVHVIAEPVDSARAELVRRAQAFIQHAGGQDIEAFLEYGHHDKTHYVITASRPECKELGPYLDTLLALRGIKVADTSPAFESTASGTISDERTQEITARFRRVADPSYSTGNIASAAAASTGWGIELPAHNRTMSSQPTMYLRGDDVRQAIDSGTDSQRVQGTTAAGGRTPVVDDPSDSETTIRFVRPKFAEPGAIEKYDPDRTAKVVSPWPAKSAAAKHHPEAPSPRPVVVRSQPPNQPGPRNYPVWQEKAVSPAGSQPIQSSPKTAEPAPHQNGSGGHRLVLPPVRRASAGMAASAPPGDVTSGESSPRGNADPKLLYMTLALVMVSLAAIALGLGWYVHSNAPVAVSSGAVAALSTASSAGDAAGPAAAGAPAMAVPTQALQQSGAASVSPLLLSIAFISAVLIFAAVVVLFMAVKKGT